MDDTTRTKITSKLRAYLNREPSEAEVMNGQSDSNLMHWIAQDDAKVQNDLIAQVAETAGVDIASLIAKSNDIIAK